jgi:hypothetical protein
VLAGVEAAAPESQEGLARFARARHIGLQVIPRIEEELRDLLELERPSTGTGKCGLRRM